MTNDELDDEFLVSLVDQQSERVNVEYKTWISLATAEAKSKLAKHLCALANFGGGWIVFGIDDNGKHSEPHPGELSEYNHDTINAIVSKYLTPAFECEVHYANSKITGQPYPVVLVPSHGPVPICVKKNGPQKNGKITGVRMGNHYMRVPGPRSVPIEDAELWRSVIHRCVINERESLLSSISRLFDHPTEVQIAEDIDRILDEGIAHWDRSQLESGWKVDPLANRCAFAFRLLDSSDRPVPTISLEALLRAIDEASVAAKHESQFGWPLFEKSGGTDKPAVEVFQDDVDGYRSVMIHRDGLYVTAPAIWRVSCDGRGVEVRGYHEDSGWVESAVVQRRGPDAWAPEKYFAPRLEQLRLFQFVMFVRLFARNFENVAKLEMGVDFQGLAGREIKDTDPGVYYSVSRQASVSGRRVRIQSSPESLTGNGSVEAAAKLIAPVGRLFDGWEITSDAIRASLEYYSRRHLPV